MKPRYHFNQSLRDARGVSGEDGDGGGGQLERHLWTLQRNRKQTIFHAGQIKMAADIVVKITLMTSDLISLFNYSEQSYWWIEIFHLNTVQLQSSLSPSDPLRIPYRSPLWSPLWYPLWSPSDPHRSPTDPAAIPILISSFYYLSL